MNTVLLVLTLCSPVTGDCDSYTVETFSESMTDEQALDACENTIIASGQKGAFPLRCEL